MPGWWDRLFRRYQLPLYVYAFELVRDEQTALDIVQETFIRAARYIHQLREDAKFGSWLFGIAHQECLKQWRRSKRPMEALPEDWEPEGVEGDTDDPAELLIRKEQEETFYHLVELLAPGHRSVLLLHVVEGFPLEEISRITGVPIGNVKSRLHYARNFLRRKLEESP